MLRNALILLLAAAPAFAEGLPEFNLNSLRLKDLQDRGFNPVMADGILAYDMIPNAPEPVFVRVDGGPMPKPPAREVYQVYDTNPGPAIPPPLSKAGYMLMTSSTRLKINRRKGELTVTFPEIQFAGGAFGDKSDLFVKFSIGPSTPSISWAAVMCSGTSYIGYKGATVAFPSRSGSFSIKETLALGAPKGGIARTHAWLTGGMMALDDLCSDAFREKMRDARAETLPPRIGKYNFKFNPRKNTLNAAW
jgi:hypothetical protein